MESYEIKFNFKKKDGFWETGAKETIEVKYNEKSMKDNHDRACDMFEKKLKKDGITEYKIVCISYQG